jgi:hypothetical protein
MLLCLIIVAAHAFFGVDNVKISAYYDPALLPDFLSCNFELEKDRLVHHNIIDEDENLVPCWTLYHRLRPRTLVLCKVTLHGWNIGNCDGKFKRVSVCKFRALFEIHSHRTSSILSMLTLSES